MSMKFNNIKYGKPHKTVVDGVENKKKTIFSDISFFNGGEEDYTTIEKISSEEFENIVRELENHGKLKFLEVSNSLFSILKEEKKYIPQLEALAIKKVQEQFGIPDSIMNKIKTKITLDVPQSQIYKPIPKPKRDFTVEEKEIIKINVEKRKIQNALMMGAGFRAHTTFNSIKEDLDKINPLLYPLYEKTMPNISFLIWSLPLEDMMKQSIAAGISQIKKEKDGRLNVEAIAMMFPILLHETTKSAMELLFSNYIIELTKQHGTEIAQEVIRQSDVPLEEVWMKRIGPTLWKYLHNTFDYVIKHDRLGKYELVSYLINKISLMEPKEFINFMNIIVYDGEESLKYVNSMIDEIENKIESFEKQNSDTTKTTDQMSIDELTVEMNIASEEERYEYAAELSKLIQTKKK